MSKRSSKPRLVIHLGLHKTGSSSLQHWLLRHQTVLDPHLACYNLADGSSNSIKFAAQALVLGQLTMAGYRQHVTEWLPVFDAIEHPAILLTDEGLLGLPIGSVTGDYHETGFYPFAASIVEVFAEVFVEYDPIFVVMQRDTETWLRSIHNQMYRQGYASNNFDEFAADHAGKIDWSSLVATLEATIAHGGKGRGRLEVLQFEEEFATETVSDMGFFQILGLPPDLMSQCEPTLPHINRSLPISVLNVPKRPVMLLGAQNSMLEGGWVNLMRRQFETMVEVTNLSVLSCSSATALYRFISHQNRPEDEAVFWEYGQNEFDHMQAGQTLESILYHVEWLIQQCIRQQRPFVPVLMSTCTQMSFGDDPCLSGLRRLFEAYKINYVDVPTLLSVLGRGSVDLAHWYADDTYYNVLTELPVRVAEQAMLTLLKAQPPVQIPERAAHFEGRDLVLVYPDGGAHEVFDNGAIRLPFEAYKDDSLRFSISGHVMAAVIVTTGAGPAVSIEIDDIPLPGIWSTQVDYGDDAPIQHVRQLVLPGQTGVDTASSVTVRALQSTEQAPKLQSGYVWKTSDATAMSAHRMNGVSALVAEIFQA